MSRKGNRIDNGTTEQAIGYMKDKFFRGREWPDFESSKAEPDYYIVHWNTRRRQVKPKGLTPEEFRGQSPTTPSLFKPPKFWDANHYRVGDFEESNK